MKCRVCGEQITHKSEVRRIQCLINKATGKEYHYDRVLSTCKDCLREYNRKIKAKSRKNYAPEHKKA